MRNLLRLLTAAALLAPALAVAQASVQVRMDLPIVIPQLVVVQPGVQVIPDVEEEVFFTGGWYWVRQDGYWYRSHSPRQGWRVVPVERVPHRLVGIPPGQYRRWHPEPPPPRPAPARYGPAPARYAPPAPAPGRMMSGEERGERHDREHGDRDHEGRGHGHDKGDRRHDEGRHEGWN
jgi:hypothetical protein